MTTKNRFNLIDEPWIPIVNVGKVSLKQIFSDPSYRALSGNPVQKIALTKLLLAIAQAAYTPKDDDDWAQLGSAGMANACLRYLEKWHDSFWLYGAKPFLQTKELHFFKEQPIGALMQEIAIGNNTILTNSQLSRSIADSEWALILLVDQNFSVKHNLAYGALTVKDSKGKGKATKSGPALGPSSYLHTFLQGDSVMQSIWFNLLSEEKIDSLPFKYKRKDSNPVWELFIDDRESKDAKILKDSYMGRLCPMSRFIVRNENTVRYAEGIMYPSHSEGGREISAAYGLSKKNNFYALRVSTDVRPWRLLPALLSFFNAASIDSVDCAQLRLSLDGGRLRRCSDGFGVWSGGILLEGDSYSQYAKGDNDFVESYVRLENYFFEDPSGWIIWLEQEIKELEGVSKKIKNACYFYHQREIKGSNQRDNRADSIAKNAVSDFWQLCERRFQDLVNACTDPGKSKTLRATFANFAQKSYDIFCPKDTARQLDAWAKNKPNLGNYLS